MGLKQLHLKNILITYLSCFLAFAPLSAYGAPLTPDGSTRTTLDKARNNVPIVNIANPNASGLSHNKFTHYNVNREGLILNNANTSTVNTQLGGYIYGNPNLGSSAKVILNEVTSTNRSALNGYTEVAGPRTDLVIANPNGLTINGAGFINTSNVTLTTGRPNILNGTLNSLNVTGGDIAIQGMGLNTQDQTSTSIYTQYLNLNAKIHAQNLDIKLGSNTIDYQNKVITASGMSANPRAVLLDASALGGMYANRITLVGTDKGLGVNLPPEVLASTGDIFISNDGTISLQKVSAGQQINIQSANDILLGDNLYSGTNVTLGAGKTVTVNGGITAAKNSMTINAAQLTNQGTIIAGLNSDGTLNTTGTANITSGTINNNGQIQSTGNLNVTATGTVTNNGVLNAGNTLTVTSNNLTNNQTLFAGNNMNLYTTSVLSNNENANIFAMNNLVMAADAANARTNRIQNISGDISTFSGDISIYSTDFINKRTQDIATVYSRELSNTFYNFDNVAARTAGVISGYAVGRRAWYWTYLDGYGYRVNVVRSWRDTEGVVVNIDNITPTGIPLSRAANLSSGRNLLLDSLTVNNEISSISSQNNMTINAGTLNNNSVKFGGNIRFTNLNSGAGYNQVYSYDPVSGASVLLVQSQVGSYNYLINSTAAPLFSTIQAGGTISGIVTNVNNGILQNQPIAPSTVNPASMTITPPAGTNGLFVVSQNPQSQFLIETNPQFTLYGNFISSSYLLQRINYSPDRTMKRLGDAFYENKLIRDSIFAQTGRRFLSSDLTSDWAQYQYLMDNALKAQEDLQLIPGVSLTHAQIAALSMDIVWLEEQVVAGQRVLVPVVYIANVSDYQVESGKIIAGDDIELLLSELNNSGLLEAGNSLNIQASDSITNQSGTIRAGENLSLFAENDIENISASIKGKNIILASADGSIINKRYSKELVSKGSSYRDATTFVGQAGGIEATESLTLDAAKTIAVTGSRLKAKEMNLNAGQVEIAATIKKSDVFVGDAKYYNSGQSTEHLSADIEGINVAINSSGKTTIKGSNVSAEENLNIQASQIDILAVNDSSYFASKFSSKGMLSKKTSTIKKATSTNVASNISGGNVNLTTTKDDIAVVGSNVAAENKLALNSAGNINVQAGYDGTMDETHTKKSGLFTGGALFSRSEDLEGKLTKTAVLANLSGGDVSLKAKEDIALKGVNVAARDGLTGTAENITVENVNNEEKTYSKHEKLTVGLGDLAKSILNPLSAVNVKDGKASITLAKAEFSNAEKVTTKTTVVSSNLEANNINLTASSGEQDSEDHEKVNGEARDGAQEYEKDSDDIDRSNRKGNINIKGSNLVASGDINLTADNDVNITEAKSTEKTSSKEQTGKAELKLTVKNEFVQIGYAVKAAKEAKDNLQKSKSDYTQYKRDLGKQRAKLIKLKADLANGKVGIEQADIDEFEGLIDDLKADDAFYKGNMALAAADLATKTVAVASQMAAATASSEFAGFSASLELDIDLLEEQFEAYKERSVASNLVATDINITSGATTTVQGSNLQARDAINIDSDNLNVVASVDVNTSSNSSEHKNLNISVGTSGAMSASASLDSSKGSSRGLTHQNSRLNANNININTGDHTTIIGANIAANDELNLSTEHLEVASVQDSQRSNSKSQGFSVSGSSDGISGAGVRSGNSRSNQKETVLTTLSGNKVNIDVEEDTVLKGAMIAAVDSEGNDTGDLNLTTKTLEVSSLNNRRDSKSMSLGLNAGISNQKQRDRSDNESTLSTVSIDFANDRSNSKSKTLGTIGKGSIEVGNVDKSNVRMLNRDINDNEVDIYNVERHQGLKGSLDTRLLTKKGRAEIADDIKKAKVGFYDVVKDVMTKEELTVLDSFSHQKNKIAFYDAMQKAMRENEGGIRDVFANPDATKEQRSAVMQQVADGINAHLGVKTKNNVAVISTDAKTKDGKEIAGAYHEPSGDIVLNDKNLDNTGEAVNTLGHEKGHDLGYGEEGSKVMGKLLEDYANFGMWNYGDDETLANSNTHNGTIDSKGNTIETTDKVSKNFAKRHDNGKLDYKLKKVTLKSKNSENPTIKGRVFFIDEKVADNFEKAIQELKKEGLPHLINNTFRLKDSSEIKTNNTKAKGLSRHQGGFAVDINGIKGLDKENLKKVDAIFSKHGIHPLKNRKKDYPHFSADPKKHGYKNLNEAVKENVKDYKENYSGTNVYE